MFGQLRIEVAMIHPRLHHGDEFLECRLCFPGKSRVILDGLAGRLNRILGPARRLCRSLCGEEVDAQDGQPHNNKPAAADSACRPLVGCCTNAV